MEALAKEIGVGPVWLIVGGFIGYVIRLLVDQQLRRDLEGYKHALAVVGKRLDFLHQERGKAALSLVRLMKAAKMHVKLLVDPLQLGPVDREQACKAAHAACAEVHNLVADSSFLFPKSLEDQMLETRSSLWSILDAATVLFREASRKGESPFNDQNFRELLKKFRTEFEPLEAAMIAEIRTLLGATDEADNS